MMMVVKRKRQKDLLNAVIVVCIIVLVGLFAFGKPLGLFKFKRAYKEALPPPAPSTGMGEEVLPIKIVIPEGFGHIIEGYKSKTKDAPVIIHIQDIHINYEAQKNMAMMIEGLIKEKGLKLIMVEGGWGDVSLTYLRNYADEERRLEVAEEYLREGKISGEEYLDIISDYDMELQGLEREELYKKNLDAFFKIEAFRKKGTKKIEQLKRIVDKLKKKIYPKGLLALEKIKSDYDSEKIALARYYKHLEGLANKLGADTSRYPNFDRFMKAVEIEKEIDFSKVEDERNELIENLSETLDKEKLAVLVSKSLEFRLNKLSPAGYHTFLKEAAQEADVSLEDYQGLNRYVDYIQGHEKINTNALFKEADALNQQLAQQLLGSKKEGNLYALSRTLDVLDNFLNLKLIPDNFNYYKEHKNDFLISGWLPFLEGQIKKYKLRAALPTDVAVLDNNLSTLAEFYEIADQRDVVFVRNAKALMEEKEQDIAVLIAGGFHTANLIDMFKKEGISYIIVAPKTTQKTDPELYRYILKYKSGREE